MECEEVNKMADDRDGRVGRGQGAVEAALDSIEPSDRPKAPNTPLSLI